MESPPPAEESPPPAEESPPPVEETPPPVVESPPPVTESPPPVTESPPPAEETPPPVTESPPVAEAPPPIVEAPPPTVEGPPPGMPPEGFGGLADPREDGAGPVFAPYDGVVYDLPALTPLGLNMVSGLEPERGENSAARQNGQDPGEKTRTKELRVPLDGGLHGGSSTSASGGLASGVSSGSVSVLAALLALLLLAPQCLGSLLAVAVARPLRTALILQVERPG